jgi:ABC-type multidrug transport system fused ATPase/permease subunit
VILPALKKSKGDLVIIAPDTMTIDEVMKQFLFDSIFPLEKFYQVQIQYHELNNAVAALNELNNELNRLLALYFEGNTIIKIIGSTSRKIRRTLSKMHISLRNIAYLEQEIMSEKKDAVSYLQKSIFLTPFTDYFSDHMEPSSIIDKNAQLTAMNFAAEETTNFSIIQATLIAAIVGAVVGWLATLATR